MPMNAAIKAELDKLEDAPHEEVNVVVLLERYVAEHPEDNQAAYRYGSALRVIGRCREAVVVLKRVLDQTTNRVYRTAIRIRIAMAYERTAPLEAEAWFAAAIADDPNPPGWAWILRGANLANLERFDEAIECYLTSLHSDDVDRDEAFANIARCYRAKGEYDKAIDYADRACNVRRDQGTTSLRDSLRIVDSVRELAATLDRKHAH